MQRNGWSLRLVLVLTAFVGAVSIFSPMSFANPQQFDSQEPGNGPVFVQRGQDIPPHEIGFQSFGAIVPGKVVKGAPYSAVANTEMIQLLSDGNQIDHKTTSNIYRDSQGRTRREENFSGIGLVAIDGKQLSGAVFISDPVSGSDYVLEPENKIARKMPSLSADGIGPNKMFAGPGTVHVTQEGAGGVQVSAGPVVSISTESHFQSSTESLGQQTIEGLVAEGKRVVTTIPVGAMGNQRPISTVTEEWFAPAIQAIVLSTTKDPRMGEITYRLTNIERAEPPASLFTLPADYTIKDFDRIPAPRLLRNNE
jgi:hypothetical protein